LPTVYSIGIDWLRIHSDGLMWYTSKWVQRGNLKYTGMRLGDSELGFDKRHCPDFVNFVLFLHLFNFLLPIKETYFKERQ